MQKLHSGRSASACQAGGPALPGERLQKHTSRSPSLPETALVASTSATIRCRSALHTDKCCVSVRSLSLCFCRFCTFSSRPFLAALSCCASCCNFCSLSLHATGCVNHPVNSCMIDQPCSAGRQNKRLGKPPPDADSAKHMQIWARKTRTLARLPVPEAVASALPLPQWRPWTPEACPAAGGHAQTPHPAFALHCSAQWPPRRCDPSNLPLPSASARRTHEPEVRRLCWRHRAPSKP
jgi:hypothetical protein